jgi:hypothetical protein
MLWAVLIVVSLIVSLGYRAWRYRSLQAQGHEVRWSSPIVRWARRLLGRTQA